MAVTKEQMDQVHALVKELRDTWEAKLKEARGSTESAQAEFKAMEDRLNAKIDEILKRQDDIEKKAGRLPWSTGGVEPSEKSDEAKEQRKAAFETFLRYGKDALDPNQIKMLTGRIHTGLTVAEKKALAEGVDISGGYLVPDDVRNELIRKLPGFAFIRQWARVVNTSRDFVTFPKVTGGNDITTSGVTVTWGAENDEVAETEFTVGEEKIPVNLCTALVKPSNDLLEDSATDVAGLISDLLAEGFGLDEENKFINGTGVKQPEGILLAGITEVNSGSAATVTADGFIDVYYGLPQQYRANARWLIKGTTEAVARKLKDGQGQYLWGAGLAGDKPNTLLGKPIDNSEYMPATGADALVAIFGNFKYYWIAERVLMVIQRLTELYARTNQTGILAKRRIGGQVTLTNAFRILKCHV